MVNQILHQRTTRRKVCASLAVLGGAGLAGCSDDSDGADDPSGVQPPEETERAVDTPTRSDEDAGPAGSVNPAELIEAHVAALSGSNYTIRMEKSRPAMSDPLKQFEYRYDPVEPHSWISETTSLEGRSSAADQYFTESTQEVTLGLDDELQNRSQLPIDDGPLFINGAGVFDRLLLGAVVHEAESEGQEAERTKYAVNGHRRFEMADGEFVIGEAGHIKELTMEWQLTPSQAPYTLEFTLADVGATDVEAAA